MRTLRCIALAHVRDLGCSDDGKAVLFFKAVDGTLYGRSRIYLVYVKKRKRRNGKVKKDEVEEEAVVRAI